jgi:hypothetical protein
MGVRIATFKTLRFDYVKSLTPHPYAAGEQKLRNTKLPTEQVALPASVHGS